MKYFWIDPAINVKKTYSDFLSNLNTQYLINKYIYHSNSYHILLDIIFIFSNGLSAELLDSNFSRNEIENLGIDFKEILQLQNVKQASFSNFQEILEAIILNKSKTQIYLYTSGTTGRPKKVGHTWDTLTRMVKMGDRFSNNIWALAYNLTHFAGLQVFLQAFINQNPMINIFNLSSNQIFDCIKEYQITHISATPTFYRKLLSGSDNPIDTVQQVTLGGEKYDSTIINELIKVFPRAKIRNIYASTEAGSIFSSESDLFSVNNKLSKYIKISEDSELLIHTKLLGNFNSRVQKNEWYNTGDIVEKTDDIHFRIISRKNEMINVGGYKINPHEIEEELKKIDGILDCIVKGRPNRITGNLITADIVKISSISEKDLEIRINKELSNKIQYFKIPRLLNFVSEIRSTRTGKKERI